MKPKTKLQKEVVALSGGLKEIPEKERLRAYRVCFDPEGALSRNRVFCLECSHKFVKPPDVNYSGRKSFLTECPQCHKWLKILPLDNYHRSEMRYTCKLDVIGRFQVVRMFSIARYYHKGDRSRFSFYEVMQHFIREDGKVTTLSKTVQGFRFEVDCWIHYSNLEIRSISYGTLQRSKIFPDMMHKNPKILDAVRRNGYRGNLRNHIPLAFIQLIMSVPQMETMVKCGQRELFDYFAQYWPNLNDIKERLDYFWPSIKVCIRNGYIVDEVNDWIDYIKLLIHFGKDVYNAKYVCPENLQAEHNRLVYKKAEQFARQTIQTDKRIVMDERQFRKTKRKFFNLEFTEGDLCVRPLRSIREFIVEGETLGHCVYVNEYQNKVNSLIMTAQVNGNRTETVEVGLNFMRVIQSRGIRNKPTKYHERIIDLVNRNMDKISAIMQKTEKSNVLR